MWTDDGHSVILKASGSGELKKVKILNGIFDFCKHFMFTAGSPLNLYLLPISQKIPCLIMTKCKLYWICCQWQTGQWQRRPWITVSLKPQIYRATMEMFKVSRFIFLTISIMHHLLNKSSAMYSLNTKIPLLGVEPFPTIEWYLISNF